MPDRLVRVGTLLGRGVRKRCPRCGAPDIFRSFYSLKERCPHCAYGFERKEGFPYSKTLWMAIDLYFHPAT
jgi:uncharacterized protein (DUF983 family)